jgi:DNA-binding NtrC family response regulator
MVAELLLVEDEPMLQIFWEDVCAVAGVTIGCIVASSREALEALNTRQFCGVVLDVNLIGETSEAVAEKLQGMELPVIVSTGHDPESIPDAYQGFTVVQKPFRVQDMQDALQVMKTNC